MSFPSLFSNLSPDLYLLCWRRLLLIEGGCLLQQHFNDFFENGFWRCLVNGNHGGRLEGSRKMFLLPVAFLVSAGTVISSVAPFPLTRNKRGKNMIYMLYLWAFACKTKNLPNVDFYPLLYKMQAVQGCYSSFAASLGTSRVSFCLVISSTWILQSGSHLRPKWLMKLSHHICVLK